MYFLKYLITGNQSRVSDATKPRFLGLKIVHAPAADALMQIPQTIEPQAIHADTMQIWFRFCSVGFVAYLHCTERRYQLHDAVCE